MNTPLMRWLLDLDTIPADAADLRLGWEHPLPAWAWALALVAVAALCVWSYGRLRGPRPMRVALALVRGALLALLVALISGPVLVQPREQVERDWVLVLVDRSASMSVADADPVDGVRGADRPAGDRRTTRDVQLRDSLRRAAPIFKTLTDERTVVWLGFDGAAFDLARDAASKAEGSGIDLGPADGWRTRLGTALDQALDRAAARPLAGVVVFSDGRTVDPPSRAVVRRLQSEAAPVYVVPLGRDAPLGDLAVRRVSAPQRAFVRDVVPVTVEIDRFGDSARKLGATVRLVDTRNGVELDRVDLPPAGDGAGGDLAEVTLAGRSELAGDATWAVVIDAPADDLVPENNRREIAVGLVDRPLRVLYVEGYPRWEYRYLKNLLVREKSVESSVILLSADRDFAQEGTIPLARLPRTAEEFAPFDLIIIGDVPSTFFTSEQLSLIRDAVAKKGMGVLWIGGQQSTPSGWAGTELADLLPMRPPLDIPSAGVPVNMVATALASRLGVLRLQTASSSALWPHELADPAMGWSQLQWAQRIEPRQLKPTAEVLAESVQPVSGDPTPLVVAMRYGAGEVLYVATDEIWRWRYGRGELLPEQFWVQLIRMLGRERAVGAETRILLEADPRRASPGQPVRLTLRMLDAALADLKPASIAAVVETSGGERVADLELRPTGREGELAAVWIAEREDGSGPVEGRAGGGPDSAERRFRIVDSAFPEAAGASAAIEIVRPDEERRRPETDHALLRALADETGGRVLPPNDLSALAQLPRREIRTEDPITERIWNTPLALLLVVLLGALEWAGRRLISLL
ncbi:MAG: hypothetical protein U0575_06045 [Phycisphaerales bacterium]